VTHFDITGSPSNDNSFIPEMGSVEVTDGHGTVTLVALRWTPWFAAPSATHLTPSAGGMGMGMGMGMGFQGTPDCRVLEFYLTEDESPMRGVKSLKFSFSPTGAEARIRGFRIFGRPVKTDQAESILKRFKLAQGVIGRVEGPSSLLVQWPNAPAFSGITLPREVVLRCIPSLASELEPSHDTEMKVNVCAASSHPAGPLSAAASIILP